MLTNVLLMSGIALALILAGVGYAWRRSLGKAMFVLGVSAAVGLLVLAATGCGELPSSTVSKEQNAKPTSPSAKVASSEGVTNTQQMLQEYKANSLRAEHHYEGKTVVVGGKIRAIEEYSVRGSGVILPGDDPNKGQLPRVRLEGGVTLSFASNDARDWLIEKNVGDPIEAECYVNRFDHNGLPILSECGAVPE